MREKLKAEIAKKGEGLKKFLDLVASFDGIIEEEPKRFQAAMKAVKASHGMDEYDVIKSVDAQIAELKNQRQSMVGSISDKRIELRDYTDTAKDYRDKIEGLRKEIEDLEAKKKEALTRADAIESEMKAFESNFDKISNEIENELNALKGKIISYISAANGKGEPQQAKQREPSMKKPSPAISSDKKPAKSEGKPCPVCGSAMQFYSFEKAWKCYVCGHDEK